MNSVDRVKQLCKDRNIRIANLEKELGWGNGYINSLKKDFPGDRLFIVADFFGVDARWLVTGIIMTNNDNTDIANQYLSLDDQGKNAVLYTLKNEISRLQQIESARNHRNNIIALQCSKQAVSAGTGIYLEAEQMECIIVEKTDKTSKASFVVPVCGDSMEPRYHDGDLLLVSSDKNVDINEIGIFTVDGCGYVKLRGESSLISLNEKYDDITLDESARCIGRVIGKLDQNLILK